MQQQQQQQQQQHQQQQQQQQRNSFYRANRPGNLNIVNDVTSESSIQQQQQQQQLQTYNQQSLSGGYSNSYNNPGNYSSTQQTNLNSPHYIQQVSPSYSAYQGQYQSSKLSYEQSFTPKYSPGPSSAHILTKQNYFNFDVPAKSSNTQIPQSPAPAQIQNKYNPVPSSPHLTNQSKNASTAAFSTQNPRYQANYAPFSGSFQKPPHTPVSAIPYQSYSAIQSQHLSHSLSVPNSPIHPYKANHNHSIQNQHSVFQFSALNNPGLASTNGATGTATGASASCLNGQAALSNYSNFYSNTTTDTNLIDFNGVDVASNLDSFKPSSQNQSDTSNNLMNASTFSENDVDMVQEVINNMIQKEESIKLSPQGYMLSNETSSSSSSNPNSNMDNSASFGDNFDITFDAAASHKEASVDMLDINNNTVLSEAKSGSKSNLESLASIANIILNPEQKANTESKQFMYSLSNLSEAASAEFVLNYGLDNSKLKSKNGPDDTLDKSKALKKQAKPLATKDMCSHSPQSYEDGYGGDKAKPFDSLAAQSNSSIQTCPDCSKIFTNKSALAKHRLIHSNERKYSCHLCDKSFKRQDHLNGHLLTHQDKKPFVCKAPGCDKSYCDSRSLKRHVESQHQDFLAQLAHGNKDALNYLPSIGKIKANVAPNFQHEISVQDLIKSKVTQVKKDQNQQYSPITPVPGQNEESKSVAADLNANNSRPKNFFTFEEPKPEICKICGKGFKNIPALNGHMRLHGGFIKTKLGAKSTNDLANSDSNSNTSQSQQGAQNLHINQPLSNSSLLFNDDSMSSNCSSNNSFTSNFSSNNKKFNNYTTQSNLVQKPFQLPISQPQVKPKSKGKVISEKDTSSNKNTNLTSNQQIPFSQPSEQNKKTNGKIESNEKSAQMPAPNIMMPQKSTKEFQLYSNFGQNFPRNFLDPDLPSEPPKQNETENATFLPVKHSTSEQHDNSNVKENDNDKNLQMFSRIYDFTNAIMNQRATMQAAAAAAVVAAVMNQPQNQHNITKPKPKPMPLVIPQAISAFQKTSYQKPLFYPQLSNGSFMPHIYPNATLLKSPRLFDTDTKKQYTPPPMLSPFRKGPGLFYNPKNINNLFTIPNFLNNRFNGFNTNAPFSFNYNAGYGFNNEWQINEEQERFAEKNDNFERTIEENVAVEEPARNQDQIEQNLKPNLIKSKLLNQVSQTSGQMGTFFPEDTISNEVIAASLIDDSKNNKPFINIGSEYQAVIPECKQRFENEYMSTPEPEDLMWSSEVVQKLDSHQITNYLNLICKSSLVFGSSNNLELGLHILNYFDGDIKCSLKAFLDETVELPENHPITTYKYTETDIWTTEEIKKFETAILKHDKVFSEIANEVETKSINQCIEFYYLWKKVMSDNTKKKWKNLKKRRSFEDTIEQNLRSSNNGKAGFSNENESEEASIKNIENEFDDQLDEVDFTNGNTSKNYLKESQKNRLGVDENSKSRLSTPSPSQFTSNKYDRDKCNQGFVTKRKLSQHLEAKY
ncbi:zinc finger protein 541-like [Brachionus plicatilis]|uniref:Zinc finger protein 541-like n=1 Tax=Brachionus plicatilis TaxID=10195 RepID=A0A3M7S537_BRAPC|nr:zinc finger protein 541-like [Brachionus plicatilis]